jgi:hypothetical protein
MIRLRESIIWAVIFVMALLPIGRTDGCGVYYFHDEYRMVFFNPGLVKDPELHSLHLLFGMPFYYEPADPANQDYLRNCQEWVDYLGPAVQIQDVQRILYQTSADSVLSAIEGKQLSIYFPGNSFIKQLMLPSHAEALAYLKLAVHAEFAHFADTDPWGLNETLFDFDEKVKPLLASATNKLKSIKDPFLIQRYAFQLVVQSRYAAQSEQCLKYCDEYFPLDKPASILMPWAQLHKAEVLATQNRLDESIYILSRVFDLCESKKYRVHQLVNRQTLERGLKYAKTAKEKAVIFALLAYKNPGKSLQHLLKVAATDLDSRYFPQLLVREINKIEDWLLTSKVTFLSEDDGSWGGEAGVDYLPVEEVGLRMKELPYLKKNLQKDLNYLRQVRGLVESLIGKTAPTQRQFLHLAAAHLYYLDRQPLQAKMHLAKISMQANTSIQLQKNLIELLILPELMDISTPKAKNLIAASFQKIKGQADLLESRLRIYPKLMLYFSRLYQQKGDVVSAGLFYLRSSSIPTFSSDYNTAYYAKIRYFDEFASLEDLDELIVLAQKKHRSNFEKLLTDSLNVFEQKQYQDYWEQNHSEELLPLPVMPSLGQLYDLKGTIAFRQNRLKVALEAFEQLPDTYWRDTYEFGSFLTHDPFVDAQSFPWEGKRLELGSKKAMVKKMLQLEELAAKTGPQQAEAAYLLANAYFNSSYWGRWWMMDSYGKSAVSYGWGFQDRKSHNPETERVPRVYYKLSRAVAYYQKALQTTPNIELAARATYMLGYCEKFSKIVDGEFDKEYFDKGKVTYISPIFSTFRKKYGQTLAYQECLKSCPELADYFKSR